MPNPAYPCSRLQYKPRTLCHSYLSNPSLRTATQGRGPACCVAHQHRATCRHGPERAPAQCLKPRPPQYRERPIPSHGTG